MTRDQAHSVLPPLARKLGKLPMDYMTAVYEFIDWLYKNEFEILSYKERARRKDKE